jgi:leucyl-tRNA synthetase
VAEELWRRLGHETSVAFAPWPRPEAAYLEDESYELVVQVLGKVRGRARVERGATPDEVEAIARDAVASWLAGKEIVKTVAVPGRLVNFVVR